MNQSPDPYQQNPQPDANTPNNMPPFGDNTLYGQPGASPYPPGYNQPGNYPPPGYPPQQPPPGYPPQQPPPGYPPQQPPPGYPPQQPSGYLPQQSAGYPPQPFPMGYPPQGTVPPRRKTGWIIGGISAAVVIIIIAAFALISQTTHGFRPDPPSGWLATQQSTSSYGYTYIYFIHWTNQNGQLNGSLDQYYISSYSSRGQSQSSPLDGTYNYQDQTVTLNIHGNGITITVKGNISGNTMTLHAPSTYGSSSSPSTDLVFHSASQQDFDNAKQNIPTPTPTSSYSY